MVASSNPALMTTKYSGVVGYGPTTTPPCESDENTRLLAADDLCTNKGTTWSSEVAERAIRERLAARRWTDPDQQELATSPLPSDDGLCLSDKTLRATVEDSHESGFERCITSTDCLRDITTATNRRNNLLSQNQIRSKLQLWSDPLADFVLTLVIGVVTASIASGINVAEAFLFDLKDGHCDGAWYRSRTRCCAGSSSDSCLGWKKWSESLQSPPILDTAVFSVLCVACALLGCYITLWSSVSSPPSRRPIPKRATSSTHEWETGDSYQSLLDLEVKAARNDGHIPAKALYLAAGSGVAEIKVIMGGFLVPGFLGVRALIYKTLALIPTVASGLSIGKEGPLIHIAASIGEATSTAFSYFKSNIDDTKRKEITSMCTACGMSLAFGTPLVGVFFTVEEFDYRFRSRTLIRAFLCSVVATTTLKFLDPYGTGKALLLPGVTYNLTWLYVEVPLFVLLGVLGGAIGALLVKLQDIWTQLVQQTYMAQKTPLLEVAVVAILTALISFWNDLLRLPSVQLILDLISPSVVSTQAASAQPPAPIGPLALAFLLKAFLTIITLGLKVPVGIYIPSMVLGGLMGRIVGHTSHQHISQLPTSSISLAGTHQAIDTIPGIYALIGAGATLTGVTRLTATIVVALLEFSHSTSHLIPFGISILFAKWTSSLIESHSFYDRLIQVKRYPYLSNTCSSPIPEQERTLADILQPRSPQTIIQLSTSSIVSTSQLRCRLDLLSSDDKEDGTLIIMRNNHLKGIISIPSLTHALSTIIPRDSERPCLLAVGSGWDVGDHHLLSNLDGIVDLTTLINTTPVFLDLESSLDLVKECFLGLGCSCICVAKKGIFVGVVGRKELCKICSGG